MSKCTCGQDAIMYCQYTSEFYCSEECMEETIIPSLDGGIGEYVYLSHCGLLDCEDLCQV